MHVHAADVTGTLALALHLVMVDHRARPDHDLRDRVREVLLSRRTDIAFHDPGLTAIAGDDQDARVRHAGGLGRCRHEQQRNGLFDDRPRRDPHERAVPEETRVQRRERLPISGGEPAEIRLHGRRVRGQDRPDLIMADATVWNAYIKALQANQRFSNTNDGDAGFVSVKFMDSDVVLDGGIYNGSLGSGAPAGSAYFLNTNYIHYRPHAARNMVPLSPNRRYATNQDAEVQIIAWAGNLTCSGRMFQGRFDAVG